jgi:hypothetical protein
MPVCSFAWVLGIFVFLEVNLMRIFANKRSIISLLLLGIVSFLTGCSASSSEEARQAMYQLPQNLVPVNVSSEGFIVTQRIYVPVYSRFFWEHARATELTATMSVRNIDPESPLFLTGVSYYDSDGKMIRSYLDQPHRLDPMATAAFVIPRSDSTGGFGANFVVEWGSATEISEPIVETVMFGQAGSAGISFSSRGKVIDEARRLPSPAPQD